MAMKKARARLIREGVIKKGEFVPVGGSTVKGKKLLKTARAIYEGKKLPAIKKKTTTKRKTTTNKKTVRRKDVGRSSYFVYL